MSKQDTDAGQASVKTDGAAFLTALANALWDIHKARRISRSVGMVLGHFGIEVPDDTATNADAPAFKLPQVGPQADSYIGTGATFGDLTPDAQAKLTAQAVKDLRQQAYRYLRDQVDDYGRYTAQEVTRHFGKLGFPMPDTRTVITGRVRQGRDWLSISETVPGTVTEEDAKQAMLTLASHSPEYDAARSIFPNGMTDESLLREVYVETHAVWAEDSEV